MRCFYPHKVRMFDGRVVLMALGHEGDNLPCEKCRSLGCVRSRSFVPVKDWKCYPKDMENVLCLTVRY